MAPCFTLLGKETDQLARFIAALLLVAGMAACGSGEATAPEALDLSEFDVLVPSQEVMMVAAPLGDPAELSRNLLPGVCAIEYHRPGGVYTRTRQKLRLARGVTADAWRPFYYIVRSPEGTVLYRAICSIPEGDEWAEQMVAELAHPLVVKGRKASQVGSTTALRTRIARSCSEDEPTPDAPPCEIDGVEVTGDPPCDDTEYWDDFAQECVCWANCGGGSSGGGSGGTGGSGGQGGGGGSGTPTGGNTGFHISLETETEPPPLDTLPNCQAAPPTNPQQADLHNAYCSAQIASPTQRTQLQSSLGRISSKGGSCSTLAAEGQALLADTTGQGFMVFPKSVTGDMWANGDARLPGILLADQIFTTFPNGSATGTASVVIGGTTYTFVLNFDAFLAHELGHRLRGAGGHVLPNGNPVSFDTPYLVDTQACM